MSVIGWVIGAGVVGHVIKVLRRDAREAAEEKAEQERRRNTPCRFVDGFSELDFEQMARKAGKGIRRLSEISVNGPIVYGVVQSQSGVSEWNFKLDFNDYGHITGRYWLSSDNDDSNIPERVGDIIKSYINNYPFEDDYEEYEEPVINNTFYGYCPHCGKPQTVNSATFCSYCGSRIRG